MDHDQLIELLPNRVRRNYSGGLNLDKWEHGRAPQDSDRPEDWLASTTHAVNRGMPELPLEGIGFGRDAGGNIYNLAKLFRHRGEYFLGSRAYSRAGPNLGFLAKLLDSSMRLHTQVHPTREMAQEKLGVPYGKLEGYVILAVRPGIPGNIRLGFQRAPTRVQWREIIARQDIAAMEACFDKIPVEAGQVWFVPGGMVHALGAGLLLLEVMEPSDLVVRCEFERDGILVPPDARFLGRDLDFCLDFFDYRSMDLNEVQDRCRVKSELLSQSEAHEARRKLPFSKTGCVEVWELIVKREFTWFQASYFRLVIVVCGSGEINMADHRLRVTAGSRFFVAANAEALVVIPHNGAPLTLLICQPEG